MAKKNIALHTFAGAGRKRPQLNIPLERLEVDDQNPRIADEYKGGTQLDIIKVLYDEFDLEEVAFSMAANGYFDEEPIVVVPNQLPNGFAFPDSSTIEDQQIALEKLIKETKITFTVVEGNRRTATAKLLLDAKLRRTTDVDDDFPKPKSSDVIEDLKIIPAIIYPSREDVSPYLGVRHIIGTKRWQAYAIAKYIAKIIDDPANAHIPLKQRIKDIQAQIGDRSDVIRNQYICYKLIAQANSELQVNTRPVKERFSLVGVALGAPAIRAYIGLPSLKDTDLGGSLIPEGKQENLSKLIVWIFGNGRDKQPVLTDSRKISSLLAPVLASEASVAYLEKHAGEPGALDMAYEMSDGEKNYVARRIENAAKNIQNVLPYAYKYKKDKTIAMAIEDCVNALNALNKTLE